MASPESTSASKTDYRNGDLVSRLLAATPPYLYNMPLVPQSFFFSEMLRSFVQAKTAPHGSSTVGSRRGRKRTWRESKQPMSGSPEKPLELTTSTRSPPPKPCSPQLPPPIPPPPPILLPPIPSQSGDIPPSAPLWYPPMYTPNLPPQPPYSFDPLHFFIDLRVSGHIWDRKPDSKDQMPSPSEPLNLQTDDKKSGLTEQPFRQRKHVSAFSVPQPKGETSSTLSSSNSQTKESTSYKTSPTGTNYVLQNLSKIYQEVKANKDNKKNDEEGSTDEKKCKDIRELIGLELVVDYVNQEDLPADKEKELLMKLKQESESDGAQEVAVDD